MIVVAYKSKAYLPACLSALANQTYDNFEAIIVVNGVDDDSLDGADLSDNRFRVARLPTNVGFAAANNHAARCASGAWLALLNPDAVAEPQWLEELLAATARWPAAASFGSTQLSLENPAIFDGVGDVWHVAGLAWRGKCGWPATSILPEAEIFGPCAAAALYRRDLFLEVGGFDEQFFCYCEDVDIAYRLRLLGYASVQVPTAVVLHAGSGISGRSSEFSQFHGNRNRIWVFSKNTPLILLLVFVPLHLAYNVAMWIASMKLGLQKTLWRSYFAAIKGLPEIYSKRRQVQSRRKASLRSLLRVMAVNPLAPKFRDALYIAPRG